jgi:hypothetical protein
LGALFIRLFDIRSAETSFERRGFRGGNAATRARLEEAGAAFVLGYRTALRNSRVEIIFETLANIAPDFRGFAFEGAGMGLALLDWLTPWSRRRVRSFLNGPGDAHAYMVHVGAGWILARVPGRVSKFLSRFDPLLRWLLMDGYGFHEGFFRWQRYLDGRPISRRVTGYAARAFDQGLGRCLWFIDGADVSRVPGTIAGFPLARQSDLWSGVGLAAVYAGEVSEGELETLREAAGEFRPQLAQGASFAAKARQRAGNLTPYQDLACGVFCGLDATKAALLSDEALENLPLDGIEPAYETWRRRIQMKFSQSLTVKA